MKPDSNPVRVSHQPSKNIQLTNSTPFISSSAKNAHSFSSCSSRTQDWDQQAKTTPFQEDPKMLTDAREIQMMEVRNDDILQADSSSAALSSSSPINQRLPGQNRRNKRLGLVGQQQPKETSTQTNRSDQKDCPHKDIFLFWAQKADETSMGNTESLDSKKPPKQPRLVNTSPSGSSKKKVETLKCGAESPSRSPATIQRVTRKDLFLNSDVFRQLDAHVLRVGEQLRSKQEASSIQTLVLLLTRTATTPLEKVRAIWMWLCHNIAYDVDGFLGLSEKIHIPEQVVQTGRGVCSGYAHLCCQMCREAGLTCVEISGYGRGAGYRQGRSSQQKKSNHMWNAVQLEGRWFLLDACWGAGLVDVEKRLFIPRHEDFFFLTDPEHFVASHWPDQAEWQLTQPPVALEDFEKRAFKTPEFFKLLLAFLSPDLFVIQTDGGEATVSLTSARLMDFTYQLSRLCPGGSEEDVGTSHGMLTVSETKMVLKVFPPAEGLFELKVFARPSGSSEPPAWVCSHQIRCSESNGKEELPENPFPFWGLHPRAKEFGVEGCNWEEDLTVAATGRLKLGLRTSRPLSATYELFRRGLDPSLSQRCLVAQTEEETLSCHVLCPRFGYYRLSVFLKGLEEAEMKNAANFLIWCSGPINVNELFPSDLSMHCGPGTSSRRMGLSCPSHINPIINTKQGRCNITFHTQPGLEVTALLSKDGRASGLYSMERYVLVAHLEHKVSVSVQLPESGLYRVSLYGRKADGEAFVHVCDYVVRCFAGPQWFPFPRVYSLWARGCVLLQPRTGILEEGSRVKFRVKMPEVHSALVIGHSRTPLKLGRNKVWEGEVFTGPAGTMLKVAVKLSPESTSMDVVLSFDVESRSSALGHISG
ncbi:kyphoscoliosis peptidase-like [Paroedura picta]|uniref:kyphoscoliosis peptidase-like n=1 Tax=Paroedura picta TaxID=143630 RepID=UPI00405704EF